MAENTQFLTLFTSKCASRHNGVPFWHLNFQKCSETVFWHLSLPNVLRATTARTFSTSQLPKVVRTWCVLPLLTWKCAWRHDGVQFFIPHLASYLRTRRFSEPTCRPSRATKHWKNTVFCDFPTFSRAYIFFLLTFYTSEFLPGCAFPSVHIVGSLASKLPSTIEVKTMAFSGANRQPAGQLRWLHGLCWLDSSACGSLHGPAPGLPGRIHVVICRFGLGTNIC